MRRPLARSAGEQRGAADVRACGGREHEPVDLECASAVQCLTDPFVEDVEHFTRGTDRPAHHNVDVGGVGEVVVLGDVFRGGDQVKGNQDDLADVVGDEPVDDRRKGR